MGSTKKLGLLFAAALAMVFIAPAAAQAATADSPPPATASDSSDLNSLIASDPNAEFVSLEVAEKQYGFDPYAADTTESTVPVVTPFYAWWGCDWDAVSDYPHVSSGQASVHGYWVYNSGDCPATATVTVNLQALWCSGMWGCSWYTLATDVAIGVYPGSGTGHWATPHSPCATTSVVGWRGSVFVEPTDFWHPYGWTDGTPQNLSCSPPDPS
ncbi:MAG TPA: hypothetical protein VNR37_09275 [Microbacteriaceae bacterium]|nr:hypothetical protein [Microbacteriaceae bacterium]